MPLVLTMRVPARPDYIAAAVEGLTGLNYRMMWTAEAMGGVGVPALYASGVVYRREQPRREDWQSCVEVLKHGEGDCEDLAAYRAAELRMDGEPARVAIIQNPSGSYHAVVERANGSIEDPSRICIALEARRSARHG